ncbi:MAG: PfkB family carbohydrate kinase, partial [Janthinobacterium lividum]
ARHVLITLGGQGVFLLPAAHDGAASGASGSVADDARGADGATGSNGASGNAADDASGTHYPARRVDAIDTTAAGDTFIGGLAAALAAGRPVDAAVRFGQAAAALSVTRAGAQPSIPRLAEVLSQPPLDLPQTPAP